MTTEEDNKALIRSYLSEVDRGNVDALRTLSAPGFRLHLPGFPPLDIETAIESGRRFQGAFPDLSHRTEEILAEGDRVVLRTTIEGTQPGVFQGVDPTGRRVEISVVTIFRIERDKIAEVWEVADLLGLFVQLGFQVLPGPPAHNGHPPCQP
jgi:ketosteroid isomerase-like protein